MPKVLFMKNFFTESASILSDFIWIFVKKTKTTTVYLCGLITMKKESAKAKLKRDIYETAICASTGDWPWKRSLHLLTKAAREVYELTVSGRKAVSRNKYGNIRKYYMYYAKTEVNNEFR